MASRYHSVGNLGTHPAFSHRFAALVCPYGCENGVFTKVSEYDRHFLAHNPDEKTAAKWLSGRKLEQERQRGRWGKAGG